MLRKTLAAQPDHSVVIAQVGFSTNLARLLDSPPDECSPLPGRDLVEQKVKLLSLMAGAFQTIDGNSHYMEYNVVKDMKRPTARRAMADAHGLQRLRDRHRPALPRNQHRARLWLRAASSSGRGLHPLHPPPHNRPTWDLTSVLYAVLGDRGYFDLSSPGKVTVEADGFTRFAESAQGSHRYLVLRPDQKPRVLEALVQLSSQPPQRTESKKR